MQHALVYAALTTTAGVMPIFTLWYLWQLARHPVHAMLYLLWVGVPAVLSVFVAPLLVLGLIGQPAYLYFAWRRTKTGYRDRRQHPDAIGPAVLLASTPLYLLLSVPVLLEAWWLIWLLLAFCAANSAAVLRRM